MSGLKVGIVGGSMGGLFAAVLLARDGHEVTIFERSMHGLMGRGAGLVAQADVFGLLRIVGVEHAARVGVVAHERITLARDGTVLDRQRTPQMQISWDHLFKTVHDLLPPHVYRTGAAVARVKPAEGYASIVLETGEEHTFDLVIGADGVGSAVRRAVIGVESPSQYTGYVTWRGLVPEVDLPSRSNILIERFAFYTARQSHALGYLVPGLHAETTPGDRRYNWVWYRAVAPERFRDVLTDAAGQSHPYSLPPGGLRNKAREALVADAAQELPQAFADAVAAERRPFMQAIFDFEAPRMVHGRVLLLGDAAFVARPHTAMGVAKAAGDALALAAALRQETIDAALRRYEATRSPVGRDVVALGRRLGRAIMGA